MPTDCARRGEQQRRRCASCNEEALCTSSSHRPMRWSSLAPPATSPTRRSSPRCSRWPAGAASTFPSSASPSRAGPATSSSSAPRRACTEYGGLDQAAFAEARRRNLRYVDGDYNDPTTFARLKSELGKRQAPARTTWRSRRACSRRWSSSSRRPALPRTRGSSSRSRSAATSPRRASSTRCCTDVFPEECDLPHRPLPGQGSGAEHPLLPLRERVSRADLQPPLRRERADHDGRELRREGPRQVLRRDRRHPRRDPEPPAAGRQLPRDGGALVDVPRGHPRRAGEGAAHGAADERRAHGARAVPRLPRRAGRREGLVHGDVRGAAAVHRLVALGRRAVLRARGQVRSSRR